MPMSRSEVARLAGRASVAKRSQALKDEQARHMRVVQAVKTIAEHWATLSDDQRATISEAIAKGGGPR
jgi:hypothetical protein